MKRSVKKLLIIATALITLGLLSFTLLMAINGWDFSKITTVDYETKIHEIVDGIESINSISVSSDTADISFLSTSDDKIKIVCHERRVMPYNINVSDGTLSIAMDDLRQWYDFIEIGFNSPSITVYLPNVLCPSLSINERTGDIDIENDLCFRSIDIHASTGDVSCKASTKEKLAISLSTGDITLDSVSAGELDLSVSTGKVAISSVKCDGIISLKVSTGNSFFENVTCASLITKGDTGDISLKNVIASEKFNIKRTTGDVRFEHSDASEVYVKTSTGNVEGSFVSAKTFITSTSTGKVRVPHSVGGKCEITTSTGDITVEIK